MQGLSTRPRAGTEDDYAVSYANIDIFHNLDRMGEVGSGINITRTYTNPLNGTQSIAFCNPIRIIGNDGQPQEGLLLGFVAAGLVLLETAKDTLASLGAKAETVSSGAKAVELAAERHRSSKDYDVVIVDWKMPGMDGIEAVQHIREKTGEEVPILLISAYDWSDIEEAAHRAGASGFISKPLFRSTLYEKISELLGRQAKTTALEDNNADLADMRILVAEDNDINWEVVSMLLQMNGIICTRARNGQEGVDLMKGTGKDDFDMIFMDIQMPVMNGLEAAKAIRALNDRKAASIPIIAMTADAFSENVAECFAVGMNGHVAKPIDIKHVLKEIRKVKEAKHV